MPHYNLPHNHGQNMERVLNKMPHTEDFTDIAFLFQCSATIFLRNSDRIFEKK